MRSEKKLAEFGCET